jgi:hypothetical protein
VIDALSPRPEAEAGRAEAVTSNPALFATLFKKGNDMLYHTTGNPIAKTEGDRIVVSFPSGTDKAQFPLTLDQALYLYQAVRREAHAAFDPGGFAHAAEAEPIRAELITLPARRA